MIRYSCKDDIDAMTSIFDEARGTIGKLGIDQWQDGYPRLSDINKDLDLRSSRVIVDDFGNVIGTFSLFFDGEPTYDRIFDGHWLSGDENILYLTIHRVAILVSHRGKGYAREMLEYSEEEARRAGLSSLRIDTHRGNVVMRRMLEKNGFHYCGIIYLDTGAERVAYEKVLCDDKAQGDF